MRFSRLLRFSLIVLSGFSCGNLWSQTVVKPAAASSKIEPGLEQAVGWKWWVAPSATKEWGVPLPPPPVAKAPGSPEPGQPAGARPETYEVKKGDALVKIARKFDMTVPQLKQFNELPDDRIKIGQVLRIPTLEQVLAMVPPPPPPAPPEPEPAPKKKASRKKEPEKAVVVPEPDTGFEAALELENVRTQVFLDREQFSPGLIDGKSGATYLKVSEIYQQTHPDAPNPAMLKAKAEAVLKQPYTTYVLREDDFKFIKRPKETVAVAPNGKPSPGSKKTAKKDSTSPAPPPPPTIDDLVAADFLSYTSAWEFVAERFHCDEAFLRHINPQLKTTPTAGTEFQVPGVIPFEIEKALDAPLQPAADPKKPVTAAIVLLSRLEISREGKLIAVMPLATARPALRGRDRWIVLDAIPQPRLATKREPREVPKEIPTLAPDGTVIPKPEPVKPLETEQYLAPGPNNPVGILWINLAKSGSTNPLPYGLHGTSIPATMKLEGIGGLRLTNWDIARAVHLMPAGTPLQWKGK